MATTYTHKESAQEGLYEIYRNGEAVAAYTHETKGVDYIGNGKKFAVPISKEVTAIAGTLTVLETELADPVPPTPPRDPKDVVIDRQEKHIASLQEEIRELQRRASGDLTPKVPDRYKGIDMQPEGSPAWSALQGNCTPEFVKWARDGGYTKEEFLQVYTGRIKDLSYTGCKENRPDMGQNTNKE